MISDGDKDSGQMERESSKVMMVFCREVLRVGCGEGWMSTGIPDPGWICHFDY